MTAKGFKLKKFNEHAYLIKAHTHTDTEIIPVCVRERDREREKCSRALISGSFVAVFAVAFTSHSAPPFEQGMQSEKLSA